MTTLHAWEGELQHIRRLSSGNHVVSCELGVFDLKTVLNCKSIHKIKSIKEAVRQEIDWFNEEALRPRTIKSISPVALNCFKSMVFYNPYCTDVKGSCMSPEELSRLCCRRYLSGDHMLWTVSKLNEMQLDAHCIYLNYIKDPKSYIERRIKGLSSLPEKLILLQNVGRQANGEVHLGSDVNPGCHWTIAVYHRSNNLLLYGDSLGWTLPVDFLERVLPYIRIMYNTDDVTVKMMHNPQIQDGRGNHVCKSGECTNYPLQRCFNVCGVITIAIAVLSSLCAEMFSAIVAPKKENGKDMWIQDPTKYNKYLRRVLMCWIAEGKIEKDYLLPIAAPKIGEDEIGIEEADSRILLSPDNNSTSGVDSEDDFELNPRCVKQPIKQRNETENLKELKTGAKETKKLFQCHLCSQTTTRSTTLRRHMHRMHPNQQYVENVETKCSCIHCDYTCRRVKELKVHLKNCHNYTFRSEILTFNDMQGNTMFCYMYT